MEAAQSIHTSDNVAHSQVNHRQLLLGNWNIRFYFTDYFKYFEKFAPIESVS